MKVIVTGATGMLGKDLVPLLAANHEVIALSSAECDITDPSAVDVLICKNAPQLIINCAAFTDVDGCEKSPERAFAVNAAGAGHVAHAALLAGARLFHISTDYVFDGMKSTPYSELDATNPVSVYGRSKLEGEQLVLQQNWTATAPLIIRTAWLYGLQGSNFVEKIFSAAQSGRELQVVADQRGCPTWTMHLAQKIVELISTTTDGILHVANSGNCSRYEFAQAIVTKLPNKVNVMPVDSSHSNCPARRPPCTNLDCSHLESLGLIKLPDWESALEDYFRSRKESFAKTLVK